MVNSKPHTYRMYQHVDYGEVAPEHIFPVALALAAAGADVAIVDVDFATAQRTASELIKKTGRNCIALACDVTNAEHVHSMVDDAVTAFGKLDIAFCNAGICINAPAEEMTLEQWNRMAPLHRLGRPDELQAICVYLAGDASSFTTGADFSVDGAFTCF